MPAFRRQVSAAPIASIERLDDAIIIGLRTGEATGDSVWLVRRDGQWVITRSESSIVRNVPTRISENFHMAGRRRYRPGRQTIALEDPSRAKAHGVPGS
jgi:hypothetical protein